MLSPPDPGRVSARAQAVDAARGRAVHPCVPVSVVATTDAQQRSLAALSEGVAVVTGQQAGLFGGPLYTVYKAAAAIVNARALQAETGVPCAPVFWLQDEDHDFEEIRAVTLLSRDGQLARAEVVAAAGDEGCSVAARTLGPSLEPALQVLAEAVSGWPHADEVIAMHREAWSHAVSPSEAFRLWIERIFSQHGLLVIDPNAPAIVEAAREVHHASLSRAEELSQALLAHGEALAAAGKAVPVHVRPGAPLSFFHPDGPEGPRFRVEPCQGGWRWVGREGVVTTEALRSMHATTSALQRPLLQDLLLPTAAYVGGPGERAYLQQLPPLWAAFDRPMPLIVPRARFRWVDTTARKRLRQLGLAANDLATPRDELLARLGTARGALPDPAELERSLTEGPLARLERFGDEVGALDEGLARSAAKVQQAVRYHAERLATRYRRTLAREDGVTTRRLDEACARLQPGGAPQERVVGFASPAAAVGPDAFVSAVLDATVPFDGSLYDLEIG